MHWHAHPIRVTTCGFVLRSVNSADSAKGSNRLVPGCNEWEGTMSQTRAVHGDHVVHSDTDFDTDFTRSISGWAGWIFFAGTMLVVAGVLNAIYGFVAVVNDDWVVWQNRSAVLLDLSGWGWIHLALGAVLVLAGIGVFTGNIVARTIGVLAAAAVLIANFLWLPVYPFWSLTVMVIAALVIWALTAHGGELRQH